MSATPSRRPLAALLACLVAGALTGCSSSGDSGSGGTVAGPTAATAAPAQTAISGTPGTAVAINYNYVFTPTATGTPGHPLSFSIQGKPAWASFNAQSGALTGVPSATGVAPDITISVSDGITSATLPAFSITVASGTGTATLAWSEPTQNQDGSALTDLVGYRVYFGPDAKHLADKVTISSLATTSTTISGLVSGGTYYFAVTAVNSLGVESANSNIASQVI